MVNDPVKLVDACVNANAGISVTRGELAAHNLMILIRRSREGGRYELIGRLRDIANEPGTMISPKRRAGFALRWYRRLVLQRDTAWVAEHVKDLDCKGHVGKDDNTCTVCGAYHGDPCERCGGRAFHAPGCSGC